MKTSADSTPRPTKAERDERRRNEIVTAARQCVVRHGFHAASMAQVAQAAGMSVGQIYRYFPSKEAIVHAIVERIVSHRLAWIASTGHKPDLAVLLATRMLVDEVDDRDDRALLLEVTAEATRNPAVADIVRAADRRLHTLAVATVRADYPALSEADAAARVEFIATLAEGTAFRRVTDQMADPEVLTALYREVIERLLPPTSTA